MLAAYSDFPFVLCTRPWNDVSQLGFESATSARNCKDLEMHKNSPHALLNEKEMILFELN